MSGAMRRIAPAVLVGTAAVLVVGAADPGLATLLTGDDNTTTNAAKTASTTTAESGSTPQAGTVDSGRTAEDADTDEDAGDSDDGSDDGSDAAGTTTGANGGTGTAATDSGSCSGAEVSGPIVQTEWGLVQVAAQVSNGRVCAVRTIMTPDGDRKSISINARVVPELEAAVLASGDANFDNISGATVTSDGYRESLQAIIDQQ